MKIEINDAQRHFILCAIRLHDAVIDFDIDEKEFKDLHFFSKVGMKRQIALLREKLLK